MKDLVVELMSAATDARIADLAAVLDEATHAFAEAKVAEAGRNPPFVRFVHGNSRAKHTSDMTSGYVDLELSFGRHRVTISFLDLATMSEGARRLSPDPDASYDASKALLRELLALARDVARVASDPTRTSRSPEVAALVRRTTARTLATAIAATAERSDVDLPAGVVSTAPSAWGGAMVEALVKAEDASPPWRAISDEATLRRWWCDLPPMVRAVIGEPPTSRDAWTINIQSIQKDWRGDTSAVETLRLLSDLPQKDHA